MNYTDFLKEQGIVPVITINDSNKAPYVAEALAEGGITCAEITFRTAAAAEAIKLVSKTHSDFFLAAGTVLTVEQAALAAESGAKLLVAPGCDPEIDDWCVKNNMPYVPGAATPTEIGTLLSRGHELIKLFPAEALGGIKYLKAVSAPFNMIKFMPTGGVSTGNLKDYLALKQVLCCGGSWIAPAKLIDEGNFAEIRRLSAEARSIVKEVQR